MALSLEKLKSTVKTFQDNKVDYDKDYPQVVFLPEGNHKVRFITDPSDEVFVQYSSYGYFGNGVRDPEDYPDQLPEGFKNELQELYSEGFAKFNKWSYGRKYNTLAYVYLYDTDQKSENWQPGNLYVVLGNNKFAESYVNFLSTLAQDAPEEILKILDPKQAGHLLQLQFKFGKDGFCQIGAAFPQKVVDPINLEGLPYIELEKAYIKPGFNQEKYNNLVKKYKDELAKLQAGRKPAEGDQQEGGQGDQTPPNPEGKPMVPPPTEDNQQEPPFDTTPQDQKQPEAPPAETPPPAQETASKAPANDVWAKFAPKQ